MFVLIREILTYLILISIKLLNRITLLDFIFKFVAPHHLRFITSRVQYSVWNCFPSRWFMEFQKWSHTGVSWIINIIQSSLESWVDFSWYISSIENVIIPSNFLQKFIFYLISKYSFYDLLRLDIGKDFLRFFLFDIFLKQLLSISFSGAITRIISFVK